MKEHVCENCEVSSSPLWRRGTNNELLCNACGLYRRNHGIMRPIGYKSRKVKSEKSDKTEKKRKKKIEEVQEPSEETVKRIESSRNLVFMGKTFHIGDYVTLKGENYSTCYGIINNLFSDEMDEKYFTFRWLIPKQGRFFNPQFLHHSQFVIGPLHRQIESMNCIIDVFYSMPSISWIDQKLPNEIREEDDLLAADVLCMLQQ